MNEPINYFSGNLVDNKKEGKCIIIYPSLYFEGEFINDQKMDQDLFIIIVLVYYIEEIRKMINHVLLENIL